jgi:hypothetical protein
MTGPNWWRFPQRRQLGTRPARGAWSPRPWRRPRRRGRGAALVEIVDQALTLFEDFRGGTVKLFQLTLQALQLVKSVAHREAPAVAAL